MNGEMVRHRGAPEKRVQSAIVRALRTLGCDVTSTSQPQGAMMTAGIPDLYVRHSAWNIRFWVEVKAGKNKATPVQRAWHEAEREAGGMVVVAYGVDDVIRALQELGAPIEAHGLSTDGGRPWTS